MNNLPIGSIDSRLSFPVQKAIKNQSNQAGQMPIDFLHVLFHVAFLSSSQYLPAGDQSANSLQTP
jgi:hypothetical protein